MLGFFVSSLRNSFTLFLPKYLCFVFNDATLFLLSCNSCVNYETTLFRLQWKNLFCPLTTSILLCRNNFDSSVSKQLRFFCVETTLIRLCRNNFDSSVSKQLWFVCVETTLILLFRNNFDSSVSKQLWLSSSKYLCAKLPIDSCLSIVMSYLIKMPKEPDIFLERQFKTKNKYLMKIKSLD